jgi:hypothetical protein
MEMGFAQRHTVSRLLLGRTMMRVRLTRKFAECIDGVDLQGHTVGDVLELPASDARLLVAEEWAMIDERRHTICQGPPHHLRERREAPGDWFNHTR